MPHVSIHLHKRTYLGVAHENLMHGGVGQREEHDGSPQVLLTAYMCRPTNGP
jgi:hypothetical protein